MAIDRDLVARVCDRLADGESLRKACREEGVKCPTFLLWVEENEDIAEQYARARATGAEVEFERLREIVEEEPPTDMQGKTDSGWVAWKRMQVDTFKWQLSKKRPERYGDRIEQHHTGSVGLSIAIDLGGKA